MMPSGVQSQEPQPVVMVDHDPLTPCCLEAHPNETTVYALDGLGKRWMGFPPPRNSLCERKREVMPKTTPTLLGFAVRLDGIPEVLHHQALACLQQRDAVGFLIKADNQLGLSLVARNASLLTSLGMYEIALLHALTSPRLNNSHWPPRKLHTLVARADPKRLRDAGEPLPRTGPHTLYRGVAGRGRRRRIYGLSWTSSLSVAAWFANRAASWGLPDPAVYSITVPTRAVLAYSNERQEEEFLVRVPPRIRARRIPDAVGTESAPDGEEADGMV